MTRTEFDGLQEMDQLSVILEEGVVLAQNHIEGCRCFLYELEDFFVMVKFMEDSDTLKDIQSYTDASEIILAFQPHIEGSHPASRIYDTPER